MNVALHPSPAALRRLVAMYGEQVHATLTEWRARRRERAELAQMTPAELRDIGITPYDARTEVRKPFWRA